MNNIMEYQKILANNNYQTSNKNVLSSHKVLSSEQPYNSNILDHLHNSVSKLGQNNHENYTMDNGSQIIHKCSERLDNLFHNLRKLEQIEANGCIMIKPPKLRRSYNIDNITQLNMNVIEEKAANLEINLRMLEETMNIEERISLYENRLNKLEKFILCKNEKYLYNEN